MAELYRPEENNRLIQDCQDLIVSERGQKFESLRDRRSFEVCKHLAAIFEHKNHLFDLSFMVENKQEEVSPPANPLELFNPTLLIKLRKNKIMKIPASGIQTVHYFTVVPDANTLINSKGEQIFSYDGPYIYCGYEVTPDNENGLSPGSYLATLPLEDAWVSASHQLSRLN